MWDAGNLDTAPGSISDLALCIILNKDLHSVPLPFLCRLLLELNFFFFEVEIEALLYNQP